jgi:hypothetical protein
MRPLLRFVCLLTTLLAWQSCSVAAQPQIVGWIEPVRLDAEGLLLSAKLDTGAGTSSLHVAPSDMQRLRRADGDWVAFKVTGKDKRSAHFEIRVQRVARVKKASGGVQERPTVLLGICLGEVYRVAEVNLTDRSGFEQPLLVGRNFLANHFAVDSSRTNTVQPACKATTAK